MLWLNTKIGDLVSSINPKDIAFLLASNLEINKAKGSRAKAQIAADCLVAHKYFEDYFIEFYFKDSGNELRCVALGGMDKALSNFYIDRSIHHSSVVYKVFNVKKTYVDTSFNKEKGRRFELISRLGIKSSFLIPISDFGVLILNQTNRERVPKYNLVLLNHFVDSVIIPSLDLAFDNEKNFAASIRDSLTLLYNHGYFKFQLEREFENAKRGKYNLSLIMIDVDFFKYYNDINGHPKGDKVLVGIADILKHNTRKGDLVARYGGEEFVVLLFNSKLKEAVGKAEQFRKVVMNHHFENEELQPNRNLTISLGVANFPLNAKAPNELLEKADKALYQSKNAGKNVVSVYRSFK